jgi:hypothetical protein
MAEAPTSAVGPADADEPPADTAVFAAPPRRPGRRAARWVVAVLAACALFVAGMLALDRFRPDDDRGAQLPAPSIGPISAPAPTGTAGRSPAAGITAGRPPDTSAEAVDAPVVVYEVTASGSRNTGDVSYTDQDGDIIRRNGIPLPWRITFPAGPQRIPLVLVAQRKGGGDAGPVTCTITEGGKLLASTTQRGRYAAPQCSG